MPFHPQETPQCYLFTQQEVHHEYFLCQRWERDMAYRPVFSVFVCVCVFVCACMYGVCVCECVCVVCVCTVCVCGMCMYGMCVCVCDESVSVSNPLSPGAAGLSGHVERT